MISGLSVPVSTPTRRDFQNIPSEDLEGYNRIPSSPKGEIIMHIYE